ncbi:unnamed protein product [Paramecium sonneborni]|uniref:Uncharacterized protein n=1 Tax=Paramecium sonneborni TaxID=65129 RepID=A0A8S1PMV3_9CILI|nr:unnamed protein product [Paramecium sonneborni]
MQNKNKPKEMLKLQGYKRKLYNSQVRKYISINTNTVITLRYTDQVLELKKPEEPFVKEYLQLDGKDNLLLGVDDSEIGKKELKNLQLFLKQKKNLNRQKFKVVQALILQNQNDRNQIEAL